MRWSELVASVGRKRDAYKRLVGKPEARFAQYGQSCSIQKRAKHSSLSLKKSVYSSDHLQDTTRLFGHTEEHLAFS